MNPVKSYLTALLLTAFASLLIGCAEPASQVLLINNIQGYSFDNNRQLFEFDSIAITKGKVLQAGTSIGTNYPDANIIDGQGKTLIPGIIDAHGHVSSLGYTLQRIDIRESGSAAEAAEAVGNYAANNRYLNWIRGRGWNQVLWPDRQFPTAAQLDSEISDRPVWLERIDGHAGWGQQQSP